MYNALYYLSPLTGEMTSSIHGNKRMCKFSSFLLLFNINTGPIICQEQSDMLKAKWKGREIISCYWTYPFVSKRVVLITRYILFDTLNESKDDDCWMAFENLVSYNKPYPFWYSKSIHFSLTGTFSLSQRCQ